VKDIIPPKKKATPTKLVAKPAAKKTLANPVSISGASKRISTSVSPPKEAIIPKPPVARKRPVPKGEVVPDIPETIDIGNLTVEQQALEVPKPGRWKPIVAGIITTVVLLVVSVTAIAFFWYQEQLKPVDLANTGDVKVTVAPGMGPEEIGALLKKNNLIKSELGFEWYLRITRTANNLQAGSYSLSQSMSMPDIVSHLKGGKTESMRVTFLPGATVSANKEVLKKAGFQQAKIDAAFAKQYDHPVFATKPASADLEGYIYGETYEFPIDVTVEQILKRTFDELYGVIKKENLESAYKKHKLSLYKGITLASIVQREVSGHMDQRMIAGVFYNRLDEGMNLGSDVTYQYIADKEGRERDPSLDSDYNTRIHAGLPPGPIAAPGKEALLAVAKPLGSNYLYFLSGDDDKTYFGRTEAEHQRNINNHCQKKCQIL